MLYTRQDETIRNTSVILDGQRFVRCAFVNCQLIVEGRTDFDFLDCTFNDCTWTFRDAAQETITALATLASRTGTEGQSLVNAVFQSILNHRVLDLSDAGRISVNEKLDIKTTIAS